MAYGCSRCQAVEELLVDMDSNPGPDGQDRLSPGLFRALVDRGESRLRLGLDMGGRDGLGEIAALPEAPVVVVDKATGDDRTVGLPGSPVRES